MSMTPPPGLPDLAAPPRPVEQAGPKPIVAASLKFGRVGDGDGLAAAFLFEDDQGRAVLPPVILTNDLGQLGAPLAELFTKLMVEIAPPEEEPTVPVVTCRGCSTRIFGEVADRGACYSCEPQA